MPQTTCRLNPWLKSSKFGYNFFHLAKMLATKNFEPGRALKMIAKLQVSLIITRGLGSTDRIRDIGEARSIEVPLGWPISDCVLATQVTYWILQGPNRELQQLMGAAIN